MVARNRTRRPHIIAAAHHSSSAGSPSARSHVCGRGISPLCQRQVELWLASTHLVDGHRHGPVLGERTDTGLIRPGRIAATCCLLAPLVGSFHRSYAPASALATLGRLACARGDSAVRSYEHALAPRVGSPLVVFPAVQRPMADAREAIAAPDALDEHEAVSSQEVEATARAAAPHEDLRSNGKVPSQRSRFGVCVPARDAWRVTEVADMQRRAIGALSNQI